MLEIAIMSQTKLLLFSALQGIGPCLTNHLCLFRYANASEWNVSNYAINSENNNNTK